MTTWVPISKQAHTGYYWKERNGFDFVSNELVLPIVLAELHKILPYYSIGFTYEESKFIPVILLSVEKGINVYVDSQSRWLGSYVPAVLRGFPFKLADDGKGNNVLCVREHYLSQNNDDNPLFSIGSEVHMEVLKIMEFLADFEINQRATLKAAEQLAKEELIVPWELVVEIKNPRSRNFKIDGLYRIDEEKMKMLDVHRFSDLRRSGALDLAYAQIFSSKQLDQLVNRVEYFERARSESALKEVCISNDEQSLTFDNI